MYGQYGIFLLKNIHGADIDAFAALYAGADIKKYYFVVCLHIPADTRSAFPVISVQSPVSIQCCWQS